jgi:hypothetical protein
MVKALAKETRSTREIAMHKISLLIAIHWLY